MNVTQLLHKLRIIANIKIVVSLLPEMLDQHGWPIQACLWLEWVKWPIQSRFWLEWVVWSIQARLCLEWDECPIARLWPEWVAIDQSSRDSLLQRLQRIGQRVPLRLAKQEVN